MYDNTVAGGMGDSISALECIVKEAGEEASLEEGFVREHARSVGFISYFYVRSKNAGGEVGLLQPEVQYLYDLEVSEDGPVPKPNDDEVEQHFLMDVDQVKEELAKGTFKPNCGLGNHPSFQPRDVALTSEHSNLGLLHTTWHTDGGE